MLICALATIWISPDNLLVVLVGKKEDVGVIVFWKYCFSAIAQWIGSTLFLGGPSPTWHQLCKAGRNLPIGALLMASTNTFHSLAFLQTSSANALLLFSLHIVWAALGGCVFLHDRLPPRPICMVLVGLGSAVAVFVGGGHGGGDDGGGSIGGDVMAAVAGLSFASQMLLYRFMGKRVPGVSTLPISAAGSSLAMPG